MTRAGPSASKDDALRILQGLVRIDSVNPPERRDGGEGELAERIRQMLSSFGLRTRLQRVKGGRSNVIGVLDGKGAKGRRLMLNGHLDTVSVEGMTIDPFGADVDKEGRLHGRNSCDMKGAIAAMLAAVKTIADSGATLQGDLTFAGVVDEEYLSTGTRALVKEVRSDAAVVGEPTSLAAGITNAVGLHVAWQGQTFSFVSQTGESISAVVTPACSAVYSISIYLACSA